MESNGTIAPYGQKTQKGPGRQRCSTSSGLYPRGSACDGDSASPPPPCSPASRMSSSAPSPDCPRSICTTPCWPMKSATTSCNSSTTPGRASSIRLSWSSRDRSPTKISRAKVTSMPGTDHDTGQPITTCESDRSHWASAAFGVIAIGTCATYGGIHAMQGNPTASYGPGRHLAGISRTKPGLPIVNVPGCPVQPDNFMETVLYLLYQAAGIAPDDPTR